MGAGGKKADYLSYCWKGGTASRIDVKGHHRAQHNKGLSKVHAHKRVGVEQSRCIRWERVQRAIGKWILPHFFSLQTIIPFHTQMPHQ